MKLVARCAAALVATAAVSSVALATPLVAPSAGSDAILVLRARPEGELRLQYRKEGDGATQDLTVGIAADYHYIDSPQELRIYDYKLRRIFSTAHTDSFISNSLYAEVWSRATLLTNRLMLARTLQSGRSAAPSAGPAAESPFWMESEFGVVSPELPRPVITQLSNETGVHWLVGGEEVARALFQGDAVPEGIKHSLRRLWPTLVQVHPAVADALAASGRLPGELWLKPEPGRPQGMVHWTLLQARWEPAARFPLPAHATAQPTRVEGSYPDLFATLAAVAAEHRVPPSQETYRSRVHAAIARGAGLEALLWLTEMDLARGRPFALCQPGDPRDYCVLTEQAERLARTDSRTSVAYMTPVPGPADRRQFGSLPNAYVLQFLWATRAEPNAAARDTGERDLLAALKASPVPNFCKEAGVFYASEWQPYVAWQLWDFGRLMAGHLAGDLLDAIDTLEANLATSQPALF
jgi:hypothetical protein